ncbi:uncharacterized protein At4g08330, chloroplastic-like [Papaver somniferum]|uniref:uncharacterized protein At4g08330, chloroplastic-like n=1 Tax=Papaver somniferum TaxID=3469 RepID=UPI000E6FBA2C|nr:uncharacterized protein At4g08330, chloroplastic-like [Papaver somniferum]
MSNGNVSYSCGSCGYPLNLSASGIHSEHKKSNKKGGCLSFEAVDISRFTQVDKVNCLPVSWGRYRSKTKLLCRKCGVHIGYGYVVSPALCGINSPAGSNYKKVCIKIHAIQSSEED